MIQRNAPWYFLAILLIAAEVSHANDMADPSTAPPCTLSSGCTAYDEDESQGGCSGAGAGNTTDNFKPWSFTFFQSVDYVQNLALPIALTPANTVFAAFQDDMQFQTSTRLARTWKTDEESFTVAYTYYESLHPRVHTLDLNTHSMTAVYTRKFSDKFAIAADYTYSYYYLHGNSFVSQNRTGLSSQYRMSDTWDLKTRADYANANFRGSPGLNSDNYSGQFEFVRYLDSKRTNYMNAGYGAGLSDAVLNGFSYWLNNVFVGGSWSFGPDNAYQFRPTASYGLYSFQASDPLQVGTIRHDEIFVASSTLSKTLSKRWQVFGSLTYLNSDSNVVRQFYHQNVVSLGASGTW